MKLILQFDDKLIREYDNRNSSPVFGIYWEHYGKFYPQEGWTDFGTVIVGWWLQALQRLLDGAKSQKLVFMDGPYELTVQRISGQEVECRDRKRAFCCQTSIDELATSVGKAARGIVRRLESLQVAERERVSLKNGLSLLPLRKAEQLGTKNAIE